jgi:LPS export ABC transporter protein LptC
MTRALVAAVLLAGAAACSDAKAPVVVPTNALADSAEQTMFKARSLLTNAGVLRAELFADTAYFFDESTRIEMRVVNTLFFRPTGAKNATLTSREGTYNTRLGTMEARGSVVVVSEDGRRLTTPHLRFDQNKNEISSDSAFVLTEPGRRLEGIGFTSDPDMNQMRCLAACRGNAGQIRLPAAGQPEPGAPPPPRADSVVRVQPPGGTFRLP